MTRAGQTRRRPRRPGRRRPRESETRVQATRPGESRPGHENRTGILEAAMNQRMSTPPTQNIEATAHDGAINSGRRWESAAHSSPHPGGQRQIGAQFDTFMDQTTVSSSHSNANQPTSIGHGYRPSRLAFGRRADPSIPQPLDRPADRGPQAQAHRSMGHPIRRARPRTAGQGKARKRRKARGRAGAGQGSAGQGTSA